MGAGGLSGALWCPPGALLERRAPGEAGRTPAAHNPHYGRHPLSGAPAAAA